MEGVVDHHMRQIYAEVGGIDACVTEFIRVTDTQMPAKTFKQACPELLKPLNIPVTVQLLGSNPATLAYHGRKAAKLGAPAIDLNFGCPAKTVNKNRGGACLLDEPKLLYEIVSRVRDAVPPSTPVSAKIRLGYHAKQGYLETARAIEQAGATELTVHARSKADGYKPPAYWRHIAEIRSTVAIPVIANGEIWSVSDYLECRRQSQCEHFMLGRGLLARPDLALAIKAEHQGVPYCLKTWEQILPELYQFHIDTLQYYPLKYCGNRMKQWLMYLRLAYPEALHFFEKVKRLNKVQDLDREFSKVL